MYIQRVHTGVNRLNQKVSLNGYKTLQKVVKFVYLILQSLGGSLDTEFRDNGFLQRAENAWIISTGKHAGKTLQELAEVDIGYVQWIYEKVSSSFSNEQFYAVQDQLVNRGLLR